MRSRLVVFAAMLVAISASRPALAQDSSSESVETASAGESGEAPREAVELFQRARDHYRHGRYREAAADLLAAIEIDRDSPTLAYNLARVYELSGELESAIATYQRYLALLPESDAAERERTEAAIVRLTGARDYRRADEEIYLQPLYVQQRGVSDELFWTMLIGGAALTIAAVAVAISTAVLDAQANEFVLGRDGTIADRQARLDSVQALAISADVLGGAGGVALVVAALLWGLRERTVELYPQISSAGLSPTMLGLGARGRF